MYDPSVNINLKNSANTILSRRVTGSKVHVTDLLSNRLSDWLPTPPLRIQVIGSGDRNLYLGIESGNRGSGD